MGNYGRGCVHETTFGYRKKNKQLVCGCFWLAKTNIIVNVA